MRTELRIPLTILATLVLAPVASIAIEGDSLKIVKGACGTIALSAAGQIGTDLASARRYMQEKGRCDPGDAPCRVELHEIEVSPAQSARFYAVTIFTRRGAVSSGGRVITSDGRLFSIRSCPD